MFTQSEKNFIVEMQYEIANKANIKEFNSIKYPINESGYDIATISFDVLLATPAALEVLAKMLRALGVRISNNDTNILVQAGNILDRSAEWTASKTFNAVKFITKPLFIKANERTHDIFVKMIFVTIVIKSVVAIHGVETLTVLGKQKKLMTAVFKDTLNTLNLRDFKYLLKSLRKQIPLFIEKIIQFSRRFITISNINPMMTM